MEQIFGQQRRVADVGAVVMLGTLFGLIVLVFGLVHHFDPEARCASSRSRDR
ncbi:hypothetical protein I553_6790 [Mycobacterium xenopi 4042]|uniref:Uncharacterized protein n=1 Tax=Mycobacterium xenopi 4042 TaxID=1299334 RepID=X7Z3Q6_MYCXE|nr:hypothetical protein I553_6790 [Mycobacterium xenopi 4042]EUA33623.1 hypothetical protein I552_4402 [Mycobacterium xenopi 3993]